MRKILAISFVIILFANLAGYFISFTIQRHIAKAEASALIKKEKAEHLQCFSFSEESFEKLDVRENGREFVLNGKLYDVVKKELKDGKIILIAYFDHAETSLIAEFVSSFRSETQPAQNSQIIPLFSLLEFEFQTYTWTPFLVSCVIEFPSLERTLLTALLDKVSPPPDTLLS